MQCEHQGCERKATTHKYGELCLKHYKRFIRHGTTSIIVKPNYKEEKCSYCDRKVGEKGGGARGMCNRHYQNWLRHGDALHADKIRATEGSRGYKKRINSKDVHRYVYENYIGRKLNRNEIIHHVNLVKTDNRIENLYLCNGQSEHSLLHRQLEGIAGQLVERGVVVFKDGKYEINEQ